MVHMHTILLHSPMSMILIKFHKINTDNEATTTNLPAYSKQLRHYFLSITLGMSFLLPVHVTIACYSPSINII